MVRLDWLSLDGNKDCFVWMPDAGIAYQAIVIYIPKFPASIGLVNESRHYRYAYRPATHA